MLKAVVVPAQTKSTKRDAVSLDMFRKYGSMSSAVIRKSISLETLEEPKIKGKKGFLQRLEKRNKYKAAFVSKVKK